MNLKLLTAAAVLSTAIAVPALAQDPAARAPVVRQHQDSARIYHRDHGFWPADGPGIHVVAAGTGPMAANIPRPNAARRTDRVRIRDRRARRRGDWMWGMARSSQADGHRHIA